MVIDLFNAQHAVTYPRINMIRLSATQPHISYSYCTKTYHGSCGFPFSSQDLALFFFFLSEKPRLKKQIFTTTTGYRQKTNVASTLWHILSSFFPSLNFTTTTKSVGVQTVPATSEISVITSCCLACRAGTSRQSRAPCRRASWAGARTAPLSSSPPTEIQPTVNSHYLYTLKFKPVW